MAPLKLLVVEDDIANLELMTEVFLSLRAEVVPINDSLRAAGLVNEVRYDGIFLDLEMPQMHGFELARKVRLSTWNKSTPIIIVTGREDRQTMHQAFTLGATFFLQKPVDRQKLSNLFRTVQGGLFESRRRYLRVPFHTEVAFLKGSRTVRGMSKNLSQGGMQAEATELQMGDTVQLIFRIPGGGVVEATGSVIWSKENLRGVSFTKISDDNQQLIRKFVTESEKVLLP